MSTRERPESVNDNDKRHSDSPRSGSNTINTRRLVRNKGKKKKSEKFSEELGEEGGRKIGAVLDISVGDFAGEGKMGRTEKEERNISESNTDQLTAKLQSGKGPLAKNASQSIRSVISQQSALGSHLESERT